MLLTNCWDVSTLTSPPLYPLLWKGSALAQRNTEPLTNCTAVHYVMTWFGRISDQPNWPIWVTASVWPPDMCSLTAHSDSVYILCLKPLTNAHSLQSHRMNLVTMILKDLKFFFFKVKDQSLLNHISYLYITCCFIHLLLFRLKIRFHAYQKKGAYKLCDLYPTWLKIGWANGDKAEAT